MKLCRGAPASLLEEGVAGERDADEQAPLQARKVVDDDRANSTHGGGDQATSRQAVVVRLAAAFGVCVALLGLSTMRPRTNNYGVAHGEVDVVVGLATGDGIGAVMTYDAVTPECRRYVRDTPCSWTERYSCPGQEPRGAMGVVPKSSSEDYRCCCDQGLWRGLPQTSTTTASVESARVVPETRASQPAYRDDCGLEPPAEAWFPSVTGMRMRSTSTTTTTQQKAPPPVCEVPIDKYRNSKVIKAECDSLGHWQRQQQAEAKLRNHSYCHIDNRTKVMTCHRQEKCEGGETVRHRYANKTKIMTYHCDSHCKGTLYFGCCEACKRAALVPESIGVGKIACDGCDDTTQKQVRDEGEAHCEVKDGTFQCSTSEECRTGRPSQTCEVTDFTCNVYPCSVCQTPQLKAECCVECLQTMCSKSPKERLFCEGCAHAGQLGGNGQHPWWTFGIGR